MPKKFGKMNDDKQPAEFKALRSGDLHKVKVNWGKITEIAGKAVPAEAKKEVEAAQDDVKLVKPYLKIGWVDNGDLILRIKSGKTGGDHVYDCLLVKDHKSQWEAAHAAPVESKGPPGKTETDELDERAKLDAPAKIAEYGRKKTEIVRLITQTVQEGKTALAAIEKLADSVNKARDLAEKLGAEGQLGKAVALMGGVGGSLKKAEAEAEGFETKYNATFLAYKPHREGNEQLQRYKLDTKDPEVQRGLKPFQAAFEKASAAWVEATTDRKAIQDSVQHMTEVHEVMTALWSQEKKSVFTYLRVAKTFSASVADKVKAIKGTLDLSMPKADIFTRYLNTVRDDKKAMPEKQAAYATTVKQLKKLQGAEPRIVQGFRQLRLTVSSFEGAFVKFPADAQKDKEILAERAAVLKVSEEADAAMVTYNNEKKQIVTTAREISEVYKKLGGSSEATEEETEEPLTV